MANVIKHKRGSGSDPAASDLVVGEVAIRTDVGKLFTKMDNGSVSEIAGGGSDIIINTLSSSSATGGGSATFNGSAYRFTLSQPPSVSAQQLLVSINGVIQKPVAGTGQPSEGFSVSGNDIILGDAPATGADFFILTFKSLGVSEPADNSVTSAKIVDGAIVNADINASANITGTKISPNFGSQNILTTGKLGVGTTSLNSVFPVTIQAQYPGIQFLDAQGTDSFGINADGGVLKLQVGVGGSGPTQILQIATASTTITNNLNVSAGIDVTGNITATGSLSITSAAPEIFLTDSNANSDFSIVVNTGQFRIRDETNSANRLAVNSDGHVDIYENLEVGGNIEINNAPPWSVAGGNYANISLSGNDGSSSGFIYMGSGAATTNADFDLGRINFLNNTTITAQITGTTHTSANDDGRLVFYTKETGQTMAERLRITSTEATFSQNILLEGGSAHAYPHIRLHSSAANVRKWTIYNGQSWNPDALLIYDTDADSTALTIETNKLGVNKGASSLTETLEVGGNASITGNLKIATSGNGIDFSAVSDGSRSVSSNLLEDYEEGTFIPTLGWGLTPTTATGRYTKVGRLVTYTLQLIWPTNTNGNYVLMGSLPFSGMAGGNAGGGFIRYTNYSGGSDLSFHQNSNNTITIYNDSGTTITNQTLSGKRIDLVGFYYVA